MSGILYYWSKNVWSKICPILFTVLKYVSFIYWYKICRSKNVVVPFLPSPRYELMVQGAAHGCSDPSVITQQVIP